MEPLGLVDEDAVWYLLAGTPAGRRTFRVDRVAAVATTGETFGRPPDLIVGDPTGPTAPRGPRRLFVRLPGGTVVNVVGHASR